MSTPGRFFLGIYVLVALIGFPFCARGAEATLEQHLWRIILKRVEFTETPFPDALATWLKSVHAKSPRKFSVRLLEGPPVEFNFIPGVPQPRIAAAAPAPAAEINRVPPITFSLNNVPAAEALKYLCNLAGYHLDFTDDGLVISAGPVRRLDWVTKTFPMSPLAIARAKTDFAKGPLPRPEFSLEGALALNDALPAQPVSFRWSARGNAVTVEGHLESVECIEPVLKRWNSPPLKPAPPPKMTERETKVAALYDRLDALVLRDVLIGKAKLEDAIAALDQLCVEATGKKTGGLGLAIRGELSQLQVGPIYLESKEITAWEALKVILCQGASNPHLHVYRGRLALSGSAEKGGFRLRRNSRNEDLVISEYSVPPDLLPTVVLPEAKRDSIPDMNAKEFTSHSGVSFPTGPLAMYSAATQTLVIRDIPERLLQIKKAICDAYAKSRIRKRTGPIEPVILDGNQPVVDNSDSRGGR